MAGAAAPRRFFGFSAGASSSSPSPPKLSATHARSRRARARLPRNARQTQRTGARPRANENGDSVAHRIASASGMPPPSSSSSSAATPRATAEGTAGRAARGAARGAGATTPPPPSSPSSGDERRRKLRPLADMAPGGAQRESPRRRHGSNAAGTLQAGRACRSRTRPPLRRADASHGACAARLRCSETNVAGAVSQLAPPHGRGRCFCP
jgi:hypothetical protein